MNFPMSRCLECKHYRVETDEGHGAFCDIRALECIDFLKLDFFFGENFVVPSKCPWMLEYLLENDNG